MTKLTSPAAPTAIAADALPNDILANLHVVDAATGETIARVLEADATTGKVRRYAIEDGNLVREGDAFKIVDETREIRIEWIVVPVDPAASTDAEVDA
jgi:hypothetical protein